jgi:hypothetical protein
LTLGIGWLLIGCLLQLCLSLSSFCQNLDMGPVIDTN